MANIQDYINWRGDIPLEASVFNGIDALILTQIIYLDYDGLLKDCDFNSAVTISELAERFYASENFKARCDTGMLINPLTVPLLKSCGESVRFGGIKISGYKSIIDISKEEQFAAASFILSDNTVFVSFRGTDDTIVGWKEDFNLAYVDEVPAQKDAVEYLELAARNLKGDIRVGGHSKGGNLAIYASAKSTFFTKKRIIQIYNNDGPGFSEEKLKGREFVSITKKIQSYYPQFSIVGMLFNNAGNFKVVESDKLGVMQHDPFSWHLMGKEFVCLKNFDYGANFFHKTFNSWLAEIDNESREVFVNTLFDIIGASDARTNSELSRNLPKSSVKIVKAVKDLKPKQRKMLDSTIQELFKVGLSKLPTVERIIKKLLEEGETHSRELIAKAKNKISEKK